MLYCWTAVATTDAAAASAADDDDGVYCSELVMSSIGAESSWLIGRARQDIMTDILV